MPDYYWAEVSYSVIEKWESDSKGKSLYSWVNAFHLLKKFYYRVCEGDSLISYVMTFELDVE